ncbi:DUF5642 family protein [Mycobacterium sp. IDR2000157661]|uniref:DUF5642 family protein n=1 Tax=Mycobacterium sp. IDR2000157661 TaxID=2867005 RepID=UPI001EECE664|nr:DUF5642 family protein [Mycobacterium sp. IDR2000157661]
MCSTVLAVAACAAPSSPPMDAASSPQPSSQVNPARIDRVREELPSDYETAELSGPVSPAVLWGYGTAWSADPPQCAALADPVGAATAAGWSASGPGGIVHAAVAASRGAVDSAVLAECQQWTIVGGRTAGRVTRVPAPALAQATAVALVTTSTTVVEGGTETRSKSDTVTAYLGEHVAFVSVVTDPGSPTPQLGSDFASDLIVKTVSALRG